MTDFPCAVTRDLNRHQAEVDHDAEREESLDALADELIWDAIETLEIPSGLGALIVSAIECNQDIDKWLESELNDRQQAARDESDCARYGL